MAHDILIFLTWRTRAGLHLIDLQTAEALRPMLPRLAFSEGARLLELAMVPTHVHSVLWLSVQIDLPRLVQRLKGASSRLVNRDHGPMNPLQWERGYDVRSVGRRSLPAIRRYFDSQAVKHRLPWVVRYSLDPMAEERQAS